MELIKIGKELLSTYQMHIFSLMFYYTYMQFKILKKLEVQTHICNGKFTLQDYKHTEIENALKVLMEAERDRKKKEPDKQ
jgi:hypothetical protein